MITVGDLKDILNPSQELRVLSYHLRNLNLPTSRLTRSHFREYYTDEMKLLDILIEKRKLSLHDFPNSQEHCEPLTHNELGTCVICHENTRQIILWPCKCLAICDSCRVSLLVREFATCVCCRRPVEGYSKVYIP